MNQALVQDVVTEVMRRLGGPVGDNADLPAGETAGVEEPARRQALRHPHPVSEPLGQYGVFSDVDQAVLAATEAQKQLVRLSLEDRDAIVNLIKSIAGQNAEPWGRMELEETKIGRLDHKIEKLQILRLVPGVEFLRTNASSGSNGMCLEEFAPVGVIGAITPVTHSIPTLSANAINMIAAGNAIVANPHPGGARCAAHAVREYNRAIAARYAIEHLITCIVPPTLATAQAIFNHRGIALLVVTGGPAVARAALAARKRAVVAGPGNPPVVVDHTACLASAAESIITGAAYDNNLLCIGEKQVFCVESAFSGLMDNLRNRGAYLLNHSQVTALTSRAFVRHPADNQRHVNKDFVGRDAAFLAEAAGARVSPATQLLVAETPFDHPFVQEEQMMPFVPIVRVRDAAEAIDKAIDSEHGYRHTAVVHSRDIRIITDFGRRANVTLFVVNGASMSGLGLGGQGYLSYSIATPTGEGITSPLTFTRFRRMMLRGGLRMI